MPSGQQKSKYSNSRGPQKFRNILEMNIGPNSVEKKCCKCLSFLKYPSIQVNFSLKNYKAQLSYIRLRQQDAPHLLAYNI